VQQGKASATQERPASETGPYKGEQKTAPKTREWGTRKKQNSASR
jgi:hypothetical protein